MDAEIMRQILFDAGSKRKRSPNANGMHRDGGHRRGGPGDRGERVGGASPPVAEKEGASRMERAGTGSGAHTFDARPCLNPRSLSRRSAIIVGIARELLDIVTCSSSWKRREGVPCRLIESAAYLAIGVKESGGEPRRDRHITDEEDTSLSYIRTHQRGIRRGQIPRARTC